MWDWVDHLGAALFRGSVVATAGSSLVVLVMLGCRQPARRIVLARSAFLGLLVAIPAVVLAPLPRYDLIATLRDSGIFPHPLLSSPTSSPTGSPGRAARWAARALSLLYPAGVGTGLIGLGLGYWALGRLSKGTVAPSSRAQSLYDAIPYRGRGRRPRLRVAARLRRPALVLRGALRPTILIPTALESPDPDTTLSLRLSLLHELAHAERADPWFSLLGNLAQAFWFFLPPVWWIRARMQLDHEFLADHRAALAFDAPDSYASSLVGMASPPPLPARDAPEPSNRVVGPAGASSSLFQRVLMLVQCPFPVEPCPPARWSCSLTILTLLLMPALACVDLDGLRDTPPSRRPPPRTNTFHMARLAIGPQGPGPHGRVPVFTLPLRLPEHFELSVEVWGDRDSLSRYRVVGQRLGPLPLTAPAGPETWHLVRLRCDRRGLALTVDGRTIREDPGVGLDTLTETLAFEPAPDCPAQFRNLSITWDAPHSRSNGCHDRGP